MFLQLRSNLSRSRMLRNARAWLPDLLAGAFIALACAAQPLNAADLQHKAEIADLMYCYARGTDAIGNASLPDPAAAGAAVYTNCFSDDAKFSAWFPGTPFSSDAFPDRAKTPPSLPPITGPAAWARFVNQVFRSKGFDLTQHVISNVAVDVQGDRGSLSAYLVATHVIQRGNPRAVECVQMANGTYSLEVRRGQDGWKVHALDITLINFTPTYASGKGCV